jgi:hypothetical protein
MSAGYMKQTEVLQKRVGKKLDLEEENWGKHALEIEIDTSNERTWNDLIWKERTLKKRSFKDMIRKERDI